MAVARNMDVPSVPRLPWTEVRTPEKQRIQSHFPSRYDCSGFNTLDADLLDAMSVIEKLKNLAQKTREKWHAVRAAQGTKSLSEIRNKNVLTDVSSGCETIRRLGLNTSFAR